ncbi:MAG: hypothetical protein WCR49_02210 [Opitutae bacterium]
MNSSLGKITLVALASFCLWPVFMLGAEQRTYTAGRFKLSIDGIAYNSVRSWEGAGVIGDVAVENATVGGLSKKHISSIHYAPLIIEFNYEDSAAFFTLINDLLTNKSSSHAVSITELDFNYKASGPSLEILNAALLEVDFSKFDGSSKDPVRFTLVFQPGQVQAGTPNAGQPPPKTGARAALASNFKFELGALPCNRVATVSAFTAKRGTKMDNVEFSNLVLTISKADYAAWQSWSDSFLVKGKNEDGDEKSATLTFLGPDMKAVLQTVQFSHVGLVRLSAAASEVGNERISRFEAELYCEGAMIMTSGTSAAGTETPKPPAATTPETTPAGDKPADPTPVPEPAKTEPAATPPDAATTGAKATEGEPPKPTPTAPVKEGATPPPAIAGTTSPAYVPTAGDPTDQAVRDPRDFLRIEGLVRKSYESGDWESTSEETAGYVSKRPIDEILKSYEEALKKAGWEELRKSDSGNTKDLTRYYHLQYAKTVQSADFRLYQNKSGGTDITVQIETKRVGILSAIAKALQGVGAEAVAESSPNDQGARDPADFPRIARSVRKSFESSGTAKAPEETVVYRAKATMLQAEGFFVNQLNKSDWEQSVRREKGDPLGGTHEISMNFAKGRRSVRIFLKEIEPGITEINAQLSTAAAP